MEKVSVSPIFRWPKMVRQLEEIRNESRVSPKSSSCASSGTLTSEGQASSSFDFSPKNSMEKHCRPIDDVITETELKGTLIQRLHNVEQRVLKLGLELERKAEAENKQDDDEMHTPDSDSHEKRTRRKKGLKQFVKSVISGSKHKSKLAC